MKKMLFAVILVLTLSVSTQAQFVKDVPRQTVSDGAAAVFQRPSESLFSNLLGPAFDENHFQMHHSYSLTYNSLFGTTVGEYVNTMIYRFDFPLALRADIGVIHQPFGTSPVQNQFLGGQNPFQGVYLKNLQAVYQPTKDLTLSFSIQQVPQGYFFWGNPWGFGNVGFLRDPFLGW
ncbi:MAG: hypothetical protein RMI34_00160 [Chloroherpetonaceae bacterium]|nr:hypothetical protein [Chloroherpetonaceae bacterium]MCS7211143.1 hypothetical protein [Chloroherpetonaceae bacterium]MDW8018473.1 hypothetical protein [Chloroherpetonaceae bacterium]MDW8466391.1 hypothetical protein [Chloroherpetonaceae bacterium]